MTIHAVAPPRTPTATLVDTILERNGLDRPDGRALRLYAVTDEEYTAIGQELLRSAHRIEVGHTPSLALLALYIAEWFRREATSTRREWGDSGVVPDGLMTDPNARTEAVHEALRWWGVKLEQTAQRREPLLSLALQGGIPIHILREGLKSTLERYFRETMARAWACWPLDRDGVAVIADDAKNTLIQTLRNPMIVEQAGEAVHMLCVLRRKLPADIAQDRVTAWLDDNEPGWRASVPLYLPGDETALDALFCDILVEPPARMPGSARIVRVLTREGGRWSPGILLPDDAELPEGTFGLEGLAEGRFGMTLTGEAGRAFPGTLGQMYWRPGRGAIAALLTCELGQAARKPVSGIAPETPVTMRLTRSDIGPRSETWPGGEAVRSEVVAYREEIDDCAMLAGRGSVRSMADSLLVLTPKDAAVVAAQGEVERIDEMPQEALWRVTGIAIVETPSGRYRIACGEEAVERVMTLPEAWIPGLRPYDRGLALMLDGHRPRRSHQEGRVTLHGRTGTCGTGRLVWAWLDADGFSIDRQRALVLPSNFGIEAREGEDGGVVVAWSGLPGWRVRVHGGPAQEGAQGEATADAGRVTRAQVVLVDPAGRETPCTVDLAVREPHLADRAGMRATPGERITLAAMADWMLRLPRRETLDLMLTGAGRKPISIGVDQEGDVPLHELHGTVQWMLALAGSQDARVDLSIRGRRLCTLARPGLMLQESGPCVTAPAEVDLDRPDLQAVVRPFDDGTREYALTTMRAGVWESPEMGRRPGIVYLRTLGGTLTRPRFVSGAGVAQDALSAAMELADPPLRERTIGALLDGAPEDAALLTRLRAMVVSLRGLSPLSLDALRLLDGRHDTLAAMLVSASEAERDDILRLERHLPFLWMNIAKHSWQRAIDAQFDKVVTAYKLACLDDAVPRAARAMTETLETLTEAAPWFGAIRWLLGNGPEPTGDLRMIVDTHLRTHGERTNRPMPLCGVVERAGVALPPALAAVNWQAHPTLLAPVALALRLTQNIEMNHDERWRLRHALLFDRPYVTEAYAHCVAAYGS